jgi:hypothetical protein
MVFVIARSKERTRKSAAAVLRTGLEKSERSRPDFWCGTRSETRDGAAKGSPWTWSTARVKVAKSYAPAMSA